MNDEKHDEWSIKDLNITQWDGEVYHSCGIHGFSEHKKYKVDKREGETPDEQTFRVIRCILYDKNKTVKKLVYDWLGKWLEE